jgi:polysaccharide export outer membrane protein
MQSLPGLMKQLGQTFQLVLAIACWTGNLYADPLSTTAVASEYHLGVGDKIQVDVYGEEDLRLATTISPSGSIAYPFLGDLHVIGLTLKDVEQLITTGLKGGYLANPQVSVTIIEYRPFYIDGEVRQSGSYPYQPGLTLRKALSLAGGFTEKAAQTRMTVIRDSDPQKKSTPITLDDFVNPGDAINVGQHFF